VECNCLYPESPRCTEHKICKECSAAHRKIANHISDLLKYPRSSRVSSRRYQGWKQLREAAEAIEEKLVAEGRWTWLTLWKWLSFLMSMTRGSVPPQNCVESCSEVSGKQRSFGFKNWPANSTTKSRNQRWESAVRFFQSLK
jgi:hypothetical protein